MKILDFGLAKLTERQASSDPGAPTVGAGTESGVVMGTVGYMAPEQVRGERVDHRADIFAFGAILYEMLAGTRAFQKATSAETMTAILNEDPPSISRVTTDIPPALQRVVHRCLEKSTEQRFQSASDLAFALDTLSEVTGHTSVARQSGTARKPALRSRRGWLAATASVLTLACTALVLAGGWRFWRKWETSGADMESIASHPFLLCPSPDLPTHESFWSETETKLQSLDGLSQTYASRPTPQSRRRTPHCSAQKTF